MLVGHKFVTNNIFAKSFATHKLFRSDSGFRDMKLFREGLHPGLRLEDGWKSAGRPGSLL